ncbi:MAG: excinuclease ABC subunit C [Limisphaerales bacterium]|nr:MAG: excinuclease ABC subunit C [Limisphaerales bacterium]KAG0510092.1 MAG: excinuclease ABC subunit C [Limisphaerales bacterium]TXT52935.1 MAG: excinuclease ABC subunit C [Limisphaerales bacterium]
MPVTDHIRSKLSQVPHRPGVYLHKDRFGTVIYVGKARDLRKRVAQYFQSSRRLGWDLKFNALVEAIHDFDCHVVKSDAEAVLLEGKLIKEFHPRYNVSFRDDKRFLMLKVNLNDPIPRFTLTRLKLDDGARYFGPFASGGALRRTLNLVRHKFNLRGCRPLTPDASDYKHCLYAHMKVCTAPCIGNVTREQYLMQVTAGCDFLDGQCDEMATELEAQMKKAAAAQDFEQAAQLRDLLADIKRSTKKTKSFERVPYSLPVSVHPERDLEELAKVLGLAAPPQRIEGFDISNISGTFAVASLVSFWHGRPDRTNYRRFKIKTVTGQDDFACMAETIRRRYSRLKKEVGQEMSNGELRVSNAPTDAAADSSFVIRHSSLPDEGEEAPETRPTSAFDAIVHDAASRDEMTAPWVPKTPSAVRLPDLILIDGGRGQLNAACAELAKLGLGHIAIIGLAKEFEEIYQPGESAPLRLGLDHPAVKLLQRVRDESHRVANSYNAQLRLRKISESILDEFPGVGDARKQVLLKKFGSIHRLRLATVEQIAEVPGFGGRTAQELKAFLETRTERPAAKQLPEESGSP